MSSIQVTVNGETREIAHGLTVLGLIELYKLKPQGVAIELNLEVPSKERYGQITLQPGDKLEIVKFMGGG
jgi:thiamine biosynthesis protein ThiS